MKKTFLILIILIPFIASGQDKTYKRNNSQSETGIASHLLLNASNESDRNIETVLVDDRKFSRSLINFNLNKSHNLSFTEKSGRLFEFSENKDLDEEVLESAPFPDFKWQLKKSN